MCMRFWNISQKTFKMKCLVDMAKNKDALCYLKDDFISWKIYKDRIFIWNIPLFLVINLQCYEICAFLISINHKFQYSRINIDHAQNTFLLYHLIIPSKFPLRKLYKQDKRSWNMLTIPKRWILIIISVSNTCANTFSFRCFATTLSIF